MVRLRGRAQIHRYRRCKLFPQSQWLLEGGAIERGQAGYRRLSTMLRELQERYNRPMVISKTGGEGDGRASWFTHVVEEVRLAHMAGVPIHGICLYPILDYPGWIDDRRCHTGLFGAPQAQPHVQPFSYSDRGAITQATFQPLADALARVQDALSATPADHEEIASATTDRFGRLA